MRLATEVNWEEEEACFDTLAKETAKFYAIKSDKFSRYDAKQHEDESNLDSTWKHTVEHIVYPERKKKLSPPKKLAENMTFVQVANLPDLYKVFERC